MAAPSTPEYRLRLNNFLQANGGSGRLRWGIPIRGGLDHCPSWTIEAFIDGVECGSGTGGTLDAAKEEAARKALRGLLAPRF